MTYSGKDMKHKIYISPGAVTTISIATAFYIQYDQLKILCYIGIWQQFSYSWNHASTETLI
jgi:hypothetical protein